MLKIIFKAELWLKRLLLRITNQKNHFVRTGKCLKCGRCCKDIGILLDGVKISKEEEFNKLVKEEPVYSIFEKIGETHDNSWVFKCSKLKENNKCGIHLLRPIICRGYPHSFLGSLGARLHEGCGYKLFAPLDFEEIFKKAIGTKRDL